MGSEDQVQVALVIAAAANGCRSSHCAAWTLSTLSGLSVMWCRGSQALIEAYPGQGCCWTVCQTVYHTWVTITPQARQCGLTEPSFEQRRWPCSPSLAVAAQRLMELIGDGSGLLQAGLLHAGLLLIWSLRGLAAGLTKGHGVGHGGRPKDRGHPHIAYPMPLPDAHPNA